MPPPGRERRSVRLGASEPPTGGRDAMFSGFVGLAAVATTALVIAASAGGATNPRSFMSWDAAARVVHLTLQAGLGPANNGFNFDGYGRGDMQARVPVGWRVVVSCQNRGGMRHSCSVVKGSLSIRPAFAGATTADPLRGLAPGRSATFSFRASRTGSFRIACLVPGHEQARMWDVLEVSRGGRPSIWARRGP